MAGLQTRAFFPAPGQNLSRAQSKGIFPASPTPSFRTEQADFFFRFRSRESVGLRREESLFVFTIMERDRTCPSNKDATLAEFEKINETLLFFVLANGQLALVPNPHGSGEVAFRGE